MTDKVEVIARVIEDSLGLRGAVQIEGTIDDAQDILKAIDAAGYEVVPKEPTEAMLDAAWGQTGESRAMRPRVHARYKRYYQAMIAAAQEGE